MSEEENTPVEKKAKKKVKKEIPKSKATDANSSDGVSRVPGIPRLGSCIAGNAAGQSPYSCRPQPTPPAGPRELTMRQFIRGYYLAIIA